MKRFTLLCLAIPFLFSCNKTTNTTPAPLPVDSTYNLITVDAQIIRDGGGPVVPTLYASQNQIKTLVFYFSAFGPNRPADVMYCYLTGIPGGSTATPDSGIVHLPATWTSVVVMNAPKGTYQLTLHVADVKDTAAYPFNLLVE